MANKTRAQIVTRVQDYLPQMKTASKTVLVNDLVDYVVEKMSKRHDFRCLRATTYDSAILTQGNYQLPLSSFTTLGASGSGFKDILQMFWLHTYTSPDYYPISFIDDDMWHGKYGYVDYSQATRDWPSEYTILNDTICFNAQTTEDLVIRVWWQKYHLDFTTLAVNLNILDSQGNPDPDSVPHQFDAKSNMLAFMTIVYGVLEECKSELTGDEGPQELADPHTRFETYLARLIADDKDKANESFAIGPAERMGSRGSTRDPYSWARIGGNP